MSNIVIRAEAISKQYRLGEIGTGTLSHDLNRWIAKIRGREDPFSKIGDVNDRTLKKSSEYVWALKDINFEIRRGDVMGIIGRNGAGKSTLLKILSKVTKPTSGKILTKGRIASLLEVGTGFHPEMTGRENVFLNGAIMGMTKAEIKGKLDEIIEFSGVEKYIDTPVKRYSSGMYVRLAFAVAAHLNSEILVVDEVLAVGDAEFQKKCLGKMNEVSHSQGRTVLFVSHNMSAVRELCTRGILLEKGRVDFEGNIHELLETYLSEPVSISSFSDHLEDFQSRRGNGEARFTRVIVNGGKNRADPTEDTRIELTILMLEEIPSLYFTFAVLGIIERTPLTNILLKEIVKTPLTKGSQVSFELMIPAHTFRTGIFPLYLWIGRGGELAAENYCYDCVDSVIQLIYSTTKDKQILGYDPLQPNGLFNMQPIISNRKVL